jgi:hypothetical protein
LIFITASAFLNQLFFDCLRERISCGGKKKRLPNFTTGFVRRDAVPLGTFTKYTWHITNIIHVKQIFETPLVSIFIYLFIYVFLVHLTVLLAAVDSEGNGCDQMLGAFQLFALYSPSGPSWPVLG